MGRALFLVVIAAIFASSFAFNARLGSRSMVRSRQGVSSMVATPEKTEDGAAYKVTQ